MIDPAFFHTTEFFVIAAVIAALIVGFMALPATRGEARQFFVEALVGTSDTPDSDPDPSITLICRDDGSVTLIRNGLSGVRTSGMVNLAITVVGYDVTIQERLVEGSTWDPMADQAVATLTMFACERYHIAYVSESLSRFASLTLNNRPGLRAMRKLTLS